MNTHDYASRSLALHRTLCGKLETMPKHPIASRDDLSLLYTPGVAEPCREIARDPENAYIYTSKANTVAVISDGSAVLGLGNIGPLAGLPVMEGKCVIFHELAGLNAVPLVLGTQDTEEIIRIVTALAPTFGGINLEDISAPRCFEIEERLQNIGIPVMHDDQHGTAIVTLAGLINALTLTNRRKEDVRVVINGLGAAGTAILRLLYAYGIRHIVACDSRGIVSSARADLNVEKKSILDLCNAGDRRGTVQDALTDADVFIGVSKGDLLTREDIRRMRPDGIVFAMANPTPEILPDEALAGGARIVATGRSDYPNQVNNSLVFPWVFLGAIRSRKTRITESMKLRAAEAIARYVPHPTCECIVPDPLDRGVAEAVAKAMERDE